MRINDHTVLHFIEEDPPHAVFVDESSGAEVSLPAADWPRCRWAFSYFSRVISGAIRVITDEQAAKVLDLTPEQLDKLLAEAEAGYDVSKMTPGVRRPRPPSDHAFRDYLDNPHLGNPPAATGAVEGMADLVGEWKRSFESSPPLQAEQVAVEHATLRHEAEMKLNQIEELARTAIQDSDCPDCHKPTVAFVYADELLRIINDPDTLGPVYGGELDNVAKAYADVTGFEPGTPVVVDPDGSVQSLREWATGEPDDGKTLIAGVLYDKETGEEAEPIEEPPNMLPLTDTLAEREAAEDRAREARRSELLRFAAWAGTYASRAELTEDVDRYLKERP